MDKEEVLKKKNITPKSRYHSYEYLYQAIQDAMEEYSEQQGKKSWEMGYGMAVSNEVILEAENEKISKDYSIKIKSVPDFRKELVKLIECVRYDIGEYKTLTSSQIAEKFENIIRD